MPATRARKTLNLIRYSRNTGTSTGKRKIIDLFSEKSMMHPDRLQSGNAISNVLYGLAPKKTEKNRKKPVEKTETKMYITFSER